MEIAGILSQVRAGGFVNPITTGTQAVLSSFTLPTLSSLTAMANAQALANGTIAPNSTQLTSALSSMTNAYNSTQDLLGHTDKLSGVNLSGNGSLATIAKTMQSARNLNGDLSCATVLGAFGAIQNAAELISSTIQTIKDMKAFLEDIVNEISNLPGKLEAYINKVAQQIASDVAVLVQAQLDVLQNVLAQGMASLSLDPCTSQILSAVMTQPMKNEVDKVTDAIKTKKLISL